MNWKIDSTFVTDILDRINKLWSNYDIVHDAVSANIETNYIFLERRSSLELLQENTSETSEKCDPASGKHQFNK